MFNKKIIIILIVLIPLIYIPFALYDDERDNVPDSLEKFIPQSVKKFLIENIFVKKRLNKSVEKYKNLLKEKKKLLDEENKVVDKILNDLYLTGLDNLKFFKVKNNEKLISKNNKNFLLTTFQTDYLSGNTWAHTKATAYMDIYDNNIFLVSKDGIISYFEIDDLKKNKFETSIINNNLKEIINYNEWWAEPGGRGLKDILIDENNIYISYSNLVSENCYNTSILVAEINFEELNFEKFFVPPTCLIQQKGYNRWSHNSGGGRIVKFDDENFLFSHGGFKTRVKAQDDVTVFGKIIKINKSSKNWSIVSKGHRNVQGLNYNKEQNFILSTEHGPRGGDEININNLNNNSEIKNFGWPISSYGEHYGGRERNIEIYKDAPLYKSHMDHGFVEPIKYYDPSIGITEIVKVSADFNQSYTNDYFIGSMGNDLTEGDLSIHQIRLNKLNNEIIYNDVIGIGERIRDVIYVSKLKRFLLFLENSASLALLESSNN